MMASRLASRRAKIALLALSVILCVVVAEVGARLLWLRRGVPMHDPGKILYAYYPPLAAIDANPPTRDDGTFDILILAGSVFHRTHGDIENQMLEQLAAAGHRNVRIFNLGIPAHTARDSLLEYQALGAARFDLVIFYHGINEARTNNAPPELFRDDYSHYAWYETVNAMARYHDDSSFALPYTLRSLGLGIRQSLSSDRHVPIHEPRADWLAYGKDLRSVAGFESNVRAIVDIAEERGDPLLLMTFAIHVPDDYSKEAFDAKRLDYAKHRFPLEFWGRAEDVVAAVAAHNDVVRRVAAEPHAGGVMFIDQARLMNGPGRDFDDPCHFSPSGCRHFVENLLPTLLPMLGGSPPG
jgi:hypothetical protein